MMQTVYNLLGHRNYKKHHQLTINNSSILLQDNKKQLKENNTSTSRAYIMILALVFRYIKDKFVFF